MGTDLGRKIIDFWYIIEDVIKYIPNQFYHLFWEISDVPQ
jgi:hypothetical protein